MASHANRSTDLLTEADACRYSEAGLFRLYLEAELDATLSAADRDLVLDRIGTLIDALRASRGLDRDPSARELLDHYDGTPPVPIEALRREFPGARIAPAFRLESVGGRTRAFPTVRAEFDGQVLEFCPEPAHVRRLHAS